MHWVDFRIVVVDDSKNLDVLYTAVQRFKNANPRFADQVVYVGMAKECKEGESRRVGEQYKPGQGSRLSSKNNVALHVVRAAKLKLCCHDGVFSTMDDDDTFSQQYSEVLLGLAAKGAMSHQLVIPTMRPETLGVLVPEIGSCAARLEFIEVWDGMHSRHGCGAAFHYPLSALEVHKGSAGDERTELLYVPFANCAEDIRFMRLVHFMHQLNPRACVATHEVKELGLHYQESVFGKNWWASSSMKKKKYTPCNDQAACLSNWREWVRSVLPQSAALKLTRAPRISRGAF